MPRPAATKQPDTSPYVLIAGGAGFLGSHLTESLLLSGAKVVAVDDLITGSLANIAAFKRHPRYQFIQANLNQGLPPAIHDLPITHIVQTIGLEAHPQPTQATLASLITGAFSTKYLLDLAAAKGAVFVLTSSLSIYEGLASSTSLDYYYGSNPTQQAGYSLTEAKRYAEGLAEMYVRQYNLDARVARLSQVYGPRMDLADQSLLDLLINQAINGQDLVVEQEGGQEMYLTYISDAVYGLSRLLFSTNPNARRAIYPIVNPEKVSALSLAYTLRSHLPAGKEVQFQPPKDSHLIPLSSISIDRTKQDLSWEPTVTLSQGIAATIEFFKKQPPKTTTHPQPTPEQLATLATTQPSSSSKTTHTSPVASPVAATKQTPSQSDTLPLNNSALLPSSSSPSPSSQTPTPSSLTQPFQPSVAPPPILPYRNSATTPTPPPTTSAPSPAATPKTRQSKKSWFRRLFFFTLLLGFYVSWGQPLLHTGIATAFATYNTYHGAQQAKAMDFSQANKSFTTARQSFSVANQQWQRLKWSANLLGLSPSYSQISDSLTAAIAATDGLATLSQVAIAWPTQLDQAMAVVAHRQPSTSSTQSFAALVSQSQQGLTQARKQLDQAMIALSGSQTQVAGASIVATANQPQESINGSSGPIGWVQQQARSYLSQAQYWLDQANQVIEVLPAAAGQEQPVTYLIMLQNSNELRPTGGFMGSYVRLTLSQGQLTDFAIDDIYNPDGQIKEKGNPNTPIADKAAQNSLPLRDANWSANIPDSAQLVAQLYHQATGQTVDGVAFITINALKPLLAKLGPITLPQYNQTVTADNFDMLAQQHSNTNYIAGSTNKKDFLGVLASAVIAKIGQQGQSGLLALALAATTSLQDQEIQLYATQPNLALLINQNNWGGLAKPATNDYLRVIDANVAGNKSNYYITRSTTHDVNVDRNGHLSAVTTVSWKHAGKSATWPGGDNLSYVRVYVPRYATLTQAQGFNSNQVKTSVEGDKMIFAGYVTIPYGTTTTITLRYQLPDQLGLLENLNTYRLDWQKQSGIVSENLTVRFNTPTFITTATTTSTHTPAQTTADGPQWQLSATSDQTLTAQFNRTDN